MTGESIQKMACTLLEIFDGEPAFAHELMHASENMKIKTAARDCTRMYSLIYHTT